MDTTGGEPAPGAPTGHDPGPEGDLGARDTPADRPGPRRPGRPRHAEGPAVSREEIIDASLRSLTTNGYAGMSLRDLARRLGVSLATVQRHFPTKDDLYRAAVESMVAETPVRPGNELAENALPRLSTLVRYQIERTTKYPHASAAMWNDNGPGADERLTYLFEQVIPRLTIVKQNVAAAVAVGVFREVDVEVFLAIMTIGFSSMISSRFALWNLAGIDLDVEEDRQRLAAGLADLVLYGLNSRGDAPPSTNGA